MKIKLVKTIIRINNLSDTKITLLFAGLISVPMLILAASQFLTA